MLYIWGMETKMLDKADLISVTELAKIKRVSRQTIYNWLSDKKIKSETISGTIFILKSSTLYV